MPCFEPNPACRPGARRGARHRYRAATALELASRGFRCRAWCPLRREVPGARRSDPRWRRAVAILLDVTDQDW